MKRILLFILIFSSMLPLAVKAQFYLKTIDGIDYYLNQKTLTAKVQGSINKEISGNFDIPETVTFDGYVYSVTCIDTYAFRNCSKLTSVNIPNSVTHICGYAFEDCTGLTSIRIPIGVNVIGPGAFDGCSNITSIDVAEGNPVYDSRENCNAIIQTSSNILIKGCQNTTIPNSVTTIGSSAFWGCKGLTSVTIPDSVTIIDGQAFYGCSNLSSVTIGNNMENIKYGAFMDCTSLTSIIIPNSVTTIGEMVFWNCANLSSVTIGNSVTSIRDQAFYGCNSLANVYSYAEKVPECGSPSFLFYDQITLHVPAASVSAYQAAEPWKNFKEIVALPTQDDYRPMIEDGKVWKVGTISGNPVQVVDYYYFDGDTIIGGKTCKQMMCQRFVSPDYPDYDYLSQQPSLSKVGAWYEEDRRVYFYDEKKQAMVLKYDFSIGDNESLQLIDDYPPFTIGPRQTGGIEGSKGVYRDVMINQNIKSTTWLEGVGGIDGPTRNAYPEAADHVQEFLMSCVVGDEVIYLNGEYEDGATLEGARKGRFDFTHTIKTKPKAPTKRVKGDACISLSEREVARPKVKAPSKRVKGDASFKDTSEMQSLYGEYSDQRLGINLDPLDNVYLVCITDELGQVVYEKTVNAGTIVGLDIDISSYAQGRYTVIVENSQESFTGEFETQTTGIEENVKTRRLENVSIYNLQGQRISSLQKGLNIVNGHKIYVK